jgi:hypothetical protein
MVDYFDENVLANDWRKEVVQHAMSRIGRNQNYYFYMYGELGDKRWPMLRHDFVDKAYDVVEEVLSDFVDEIVNEMIERLVAQDIDVAEEVADWYNDYNWLGALDDGYLEGKVDPHKP